MWRSSCNSIKAAFVAACFILSAQTASYADTYDLNVAAPAGILHYYIEDDIIATCNGCVEINSVDYVLSASFVALDAAGDDVGSGEISMGDDYIDPTCDGIPTNICRGSTFLSGDATTFVVTTSFSGSEEIIQTMNGPLINVPFYSDEWSFNVVPSPITTPLPATLPLFATGLGGLGLLGWRRKRKAQAVGI